MNRIERKETAPDAAKLFEEEVREISPEIPREILCNMVDDYLILSTGRPHQERSAPDHG